MLNQTLAYTKETPYSWDPAHLLNALKEASKKIAPVWPLENFVAVNPYLGLTNKKFTQAAQELALAGAIQMTLPTAFYLDQIKAGELTEEDLARVLSARKERVSVQTFIRDLEKKSDAPQVTETLPTIADLATQLTRKDWDRFLVGRVSQWAASYFDKGQAIWMASDPTQSLFSSWKTEAQIDRTPELNGLKGFRKFVKALPEEPLSAVQVALEKLELSPEQAPLYFHRLLRKVGGWAAYAARLDWENALYGKEETQVIEFLSVLICWEASLMESIKEEDLEQLWRDSKQVFSGQRTASEINQHLKKNLILQEAYDLAGQRKLQEKFAVSKPQEAPKATQPKAQAIFCIDVRSEVFRRNLEMVDSSIETLGFAGFFAFPIKYIPIGQQEGEAQCPVLLKTGPTILEEITDKATHRKVLAKRHLHRQVGQLWKSFKSGAVTCFSYVSPLGLSFLPKIFTDSFGLTRPVPHPDHLGFAKKDMEGKSISLKNSTHQGETVGMPLSQQIQLAKNALTAMSLREGFGRWVLIVGHGSTTVNNPHATGYDCGACGGHTGEANARVAAAVLNNPEVRKALVEEGLSIPTNTQFLACLHDTTTDQVRILNKAEITADQREELESLEQSLALAGQGARRERSLRMGPNVSLSVDQMILERSKDWSQTRPEWGLAGCSTFVVAPRKHTKGINFQGKSFLHSYEWKKDPGFSILELIMTAPMVVTSWINLQYYGSTVDNTNLGSGNKTLHNVTAGLGVLEGYSGDLRVGLPMQAIHDGEKYQHLPERLKVVIAAPLEAINQILEKHSNVKELVDNGWIYLMTLNEEGKISHRYCGDLTWERTE